jgi:rubrerythrin
MAEALHDKLTGMELGEMLDRCRALEERAAVLYRTFAAGARSEPRLCAMWTALAREEEEHARALLAARRRLLPIEAARTRIEGWSEVLADIEERLAAAERLATAGRDRQLAAALELEMTELEALRRLVLASSGAPVPGEPQEAHALHLAEQAVRLSKDPHVDVQAALLRARARLREADA